jgi:hypothetical protein
LLTAIAAIPHAVLRSLISVGCTLLVAGTVFTFFAASKQLEHDYDQFQQWEAIIAVGFVILFVGLIWVSVQRTKRRLQREVLPMVPSDFNDDDSDALDPSHAPWPLLRHESSRLVLEEKANSTSSHHSVDEAPSEAAQRLDGTGGPEDSDDDKSLQLQSLSFSLSFSWSQQSESKSESLNSSTSLSSFSLSKWQLSASPSSSVASSPPSSRPLSLSRSPFPSLRSRSHSSEADSALDHLHRRARSYSYDSYSDNGDEGHQHGDNIDDADDDDASFHLYY